MYQKLGTVVYLAMSADATCRGLRSPRDGPLVMEFTQGLLQSNDYRASLYSLSVGHRGGSRNSLRGGGGSGPEFFEGGVRVRGNFHILTSKKKTTSEGGVNPPNPPPPLWIRYWPGICPMGKV